MENTTPIIANQTVAQTEQKQMEPIQQEEKGVSIFPEKEELAKFGEGDFKDVPKFMAEALQDAYSQYGIESGEYDLLDDKTGLTRGTVDDFETAYQNEQSNSSDSKSATIQKRELNFGGLNDVTYEYDSDGDGRFETSVTFDKEDGRQMFHRVSDENGFAAEIDTQEKTGRLTGYTTRMEDGTTSDFIHVKTEDAELNILDTGDSSYDLEYNDDGTIKDINQ